MEIDKLKLAIRELPEEEAKSLLFHVLLRMNLLRETAYSETEFISDIKNVYETVFKISRERSESSQHREFHMTHILFGDSPAGSLKYALKKMGASKKEKVISFWDMFSVGPVWKLHEKAGQQARFDFMQKVMNDEHDDFRDYQKKFYETMDQIVSIPEDVPITIWVAENAHEQTGLRYVLHLLKNKTNDIKVINSTKMFTEKFNRPDIEYFAIKTGEIIPEKLQVIYEESKAEASLSQHERKGLEEEWAALADTDETLRIWQNEKIKSVREDYYDQYMINTAKNLQIERERAEEPEAYMKSARLIGEVIGHLDQYMGDTFFEYRLRKLIEKGVFEMEGNLKAMRYYSVRLKG
ncbi:DUF1835 domain-containing protein [Cytobacillus praedii]|uniref:DUF1835 domain-containing protein n=1 Tax=Cytobacillus praedii TaxID=1742358 RepID=UPI0009EAE06C|nr:DUF1835 domain-containing protein [Cytobacillus praedii]MED3572625.1 DUF1835 domain-containing protein [Cytobacillus praedii]